MIKIPDKFKYPKVKFAWENKPLFVNEVIGKLYSSGRLYNGERLTAGINSEEGYFMYDLIKQNNFKNCLEIGMANGLSSQYICQALLENNNSGSLISIDPFQSTQWKNQGIENIKRAGLQKHSVVLEEKDYIILPKIINGILKNKAELFDFIIIDGDHRFDYTLLDFMYSDFILRKGGVILVDDVLHKSVQPVVRYIDKNYHHFKRYHISKTMAMYVKTGDDKRDWNFHVNF